MKTRSLYLMAAAGAVVWLVVAAPQPTSGQNAPLPAQTTLPQSAPQQAPLTGALPPALPRPAAARVVVEISPQLEGLIREVTAQSKQLSENQAQIDGKLDKLAETIRQARLFAARAGHGGAK